MNQKSKGKRPEIAYKSFELKIIKNGKTLNQSRTPLECDQTDMKAKMGLLGKSVDSSLRRSHCSIVEQKDSERQSPGLTPWNVFYYTFLAFFVGLVLVFLITAVFKHFSTDPKPINVQSIDHHHYHPRTDRDRRHHNDEYIESGGDELSSGEEPYKLTTSSSNVSQETNDELDGEEIIEIVIQNTSTATHLSTLTPNIRFKESDELEDKEEEEIVQSTTMPSLENSVRSFFDDKSLFYFSNDSVQLLKNYDMATVIFFFRDMSNETREAAKTFESIASKFRSWVNLLRFIVVTCPDDRLCYKLSPFDPLSKSYNSSEPFYFGYFWRHSINDCSDQNSGLVLCPDSFTQSTTSSSLEQMILAEFKNENLYRKKYPDWPDTIILSSENICKYEDVFFEIDIETKDHVLIFLNNDQLGFEALDAIVELSLLEINTKIVNSTCLMSTYGISQLPSAIVISRKLRLHRQSSKLRLFSPTYFEFESDSLKFAKRLEHIDQDELIDSTLIKLQVLVDDRIKFDKLRKMHFPCTNRLWLNSDHPIPPRLKRQEPNLNNVDGISELDAQIDYYKVLDVNEKGTRNQIRAAFRTKARIIRPDINTNDQTTLLTRARWILEDDERRTFYNALRQEMRQKREPITAATFILIGAIGAVSQATIGLIGMISDHNTLTKTETSSIELGGGDAYWNSGSYKSVTRKCTSGCPAGYSSVWNSMSRKVDSFDEHFEDLTFGPNCCSGTFKFWGKSCV